MELSQRQSKLLDFVRKQHGDQKRKYTDEPYWKHVYSVAKIVSRHEPEGIEAALCHDLFEDTACTPDALLEFLQNNGYQRLESLGILSVVRELTDRYTKENYPDLNREERKYQEAKRLGSATHIAQSTKYADLIDNTGSIVKYDHNFARVYLKEKIEILNRMRNGNIHLLIQCCWTLQNALMVLENKEKVKK